MATTKEYRGRHEIFTQILQTVSDVGSEGIPPTLFMYRSFLSYFQLKEYLSVLVENGLVEKLPQQINGSGDSNASEKFLYRTTESLHISQVSYHKTCVLLKCGGLSFWGPKSWIS